MFSREQQFQRQIEAQQTKLNKAEVERDKWQKMFTEVMAMAGGVTIPVSLDKCIRNQVMRENVRWVEPGVVLAPVSLPVESNSVNNTSTNTNSNTSTNTANKEKENKNVEKREKENKNEKAPALKPQQPQQPPSTPAPQSAVLTGRSEPKVLTSYILV